MSKFLFRRSDGMNEIDIKVLICERIIPACIKYFLFLDRIVINKLKTMNSIQYLCTHNFERHNKFAYGYFMVTLITSRNNRYHIRRLVGFISSIVYK